jgi:hypothetical protein
MRLLLPRVIQDPALRFGPPNPDKPLEGVVEQVAVEAARFDAGPATDRVVVVDYGLEGIPVPLGPTGYTLADPSKLYAADHVAVSTFATVLRVLALAEHPDVLGRSLQFPFPGRLRIEPRAGDWDNAAYERGSGSLRFWSHVPRGAARRRWTALSHDSVAHETGHLIIDALAPDLHDSTHPQSLGIHEALADLMAFVSAMQSPGLLALVLDGPAGSLDEFDVLGTIAESAAEGDEVDEADKAVPRFVRRLQGRQTLGADADPPVDRSDPHALAEVMGGLLYGLYNPELRMVQRPLDPLFGAAATDGPEVLQERARPYLQRVLGALPFLPPGENSFVDLARTIVAWEAACDGEAGADAMEFALRERGLLAAGEPLSHWSGPFDDAALTSLDVRSWRNDPQRAVAAVRAHPKLFGIEGQGRVRLRVSTEVRQHPQPVVVSRVGGPPEPTTAVPPIRMVIVRCAWDRHEPSELGPDYPETRRVRVGSTVVFDADQPGRVLLSLLPREPDAQDRSDRTAFLRRQIAAGRLGPPSGPVLGLRASVVDGHLRVEGAARSLHLQGAGNVPADGQRPVPADPGAGTQA